MTAAAQPGDSPPCKECERVKSLPEMPEMVPNAAEEWQNGFRWGWYYAVKAAREVPRVPQPGDPVSSAGCARCSDAVPPR